MHRGIGGGNFGAVTSEERGSEIQRRRLAHGIRSVREFAERTTLSREAVTKAEQGTASEGTYQRLEAWLDAFDEEISQDMPDVQIQQLGTNPESDVVEFTVEGNFGVRAVVKGPVRDIDALREAVSRIIEGMSTDQPRSVENHPNG